LDSELDQSWSRKCTSIGLRIGAELESESYLRIESELDQQWDQNLIGNGVRIGSELESESDRDWGQNQLRIDVSICLELQ